MQIVETIDGKRKVLWFSISTITLEDSRIHNPFGRLNQMLSYEFWRLSYVLMLHFKNSIFISQVIGSTMLVMHFMFSAWNTDPIHDIIKLQLEFAWEDTRRRYLAVVIYRSCNGIDLLYWITFLCHLTINAPIRHFLINLRRLQWALCKIVL